MPGRSQSSRDTVKWLPYPPEAPANDLDPDMEVEVLDVGEEEARALTQGQP